MDARARILVALLVGGVGLFLVLASIGVIDLPLSTRNRKAMFEDPRHWQITAIGLAFFFAGASLAPPETWTRTRNTLGSLCGISFLAAMVGIIPKMFH